MFAANLSCNVDAHDYLPEFTLPRSTRNNPGMSLFSSHGGSETHSLGLSWELGTCYNTEEDKGLLC